LAADAGAIAKAAHEEGEQLGDGIGMASPRRAHGDQHPVEELDLLVLEVPELDQPVILAPPQRTDPFGRQHRRIDHLHSLALRPSWPSSP